MRHALTNLSTEPKKILTAICDEFFFQWDDGIRGILLMRPTLGDAKLDRLVYQSQSWFVVGLEGDAMPADSRFDNDTLVQLAELGFLVEIEPRNPPHAVPLYLTAIRVMGGADPREDSDEDEVGADLGGGRGSESSGASKDWLFLVPSDKALAAHAELRKTSGDERPSRILSSIMLHLN